MDLTTYLEILGPIAVGLVAVWLGYRNQLASLDREVRRKAYLDALAVLRKLASLIEYAERLNFVTWKLLREGDKPLTGSDRDRLLALESPIVQLLALAEYVGLHPDWSLLEGKARPVSTDKFTHLPGEIMRTILWKGESLVDPFNDAVLMALSGTRLTFTHRSQRQVETQNVLASGFRRLTQILFSFRSPANPNPVDWNLVDRIQSDTLTLVLKDVRVFGLPEFIVSGSHDRVDWPPEVLRERLGPPPPGNPD